MTVTAPATGHALVQAFREMPEPEYMTVEELSAEVEALIAADKASTRRWACDLDDCDGLPHQGWLHMHARSSQRIPSGKWTEWMLLTGRGWGKTKTAAETVREWAKTPNLQIAVVAKKETLTREICFESPKSGLLTVIPPEEILKYSRTPGAIRLELVNGTTIFGFGAEVPDNLRGWAFDKAWCDEYAAWTRQTAQATYDMLWFCMREASDPQVIISTTPKPLPHVKKLLNKHDSQKAEIIDAVQNGVKPKFDQPRVRIVRGHTNENRANLSEVALDQLNDDYNGIRLGRQELGGEMLEDVEGALWQQWMFEDETFRLDPLTQVPYQDRKVLAIDPSVTSEETADYTAFTVAGRSTSYDATWEDGLPRGYVFLSEQHRETPEKAMRRAARLYHEHQCDMVVVEGNNGGEYLSTVMRLVDPTVPVTIVWASRDKRARAAPVATLYERGRIHHVGKPKEFADLEEQMTTYVGVGKEGEKSPDLLDSLVWALFYLFLDPSTPQAGQNRAYNDDRLPGR